MLMAPRAAGRRAAGAAARCGLTHLTHHQRNMPYLGTKATLVKARRLPLLGSRLRSSSSSSSRAGANRGSLSSRLARARHVLGALEDEAASRDRHGGGGRASKPGSSRRVADRLLSSRQPSGVVLQPLNRSRRPTPAGPLDDGIDRPWAPPRPMASREPVKSRRWVVESRDAYKSVADLIYSGADNRQERVDQARAVKAGLTRPSVGPTCGPLPGAVLPRDYVCASHAAHSLASVEGGKTHAELMADKERNNKLMMKVSAVSRRISRYILLTPPPLASPAHSSSSAARST